MTKQDRIWSNIGEVFRTEAANTLLRRLGCDARYLDGRASDFEWFSEWERVYPLALGTGVASLYREALRQLSMDEPSEGITTEESCARWKQANESLETLQNGMVEETADETAIDLSLSLSHWLGDVSFQKSRTVSSFAERLASLVGESGRARLVWNVGGASFTRPDPYHADLALTSFAAEREDEGKRFLVLAQAVIDLLLNEEIASRISLHLYSEESYETVSQFLEYLISRKIPVCPLYLGVFLRDEPRAWLPVCDRVGAHPEWILRAEDFGAGFEERLALTLATYPVGGMGIGMTIAESPLSFFMKSLLYRTAERLLVVGNSKISPRVALGRWQ